MSEKSLNTIPNVKKATTKKRKKSGRMRLLNALLICLLFPIILIAFWMFGNRQYYLFSLLLIGLSMVPFFLSFERRKPQAREIVTLAVMSAIAVASRAAFIMLVHFKPMAGIVMITGMAFGAEAGFFTGAVSAFVSNFIFGQGPWTPWQMFAYGLAGFLAGLLAKAGLLKGEKNLFSAIVGALMVFCIIGPVLDTCALFTSHADITKEFAAAIYLSGLPVNGVHALATFLTLLLLSRPITEKLERMKVKYGMMEEETV